MIFIVLAFLSGMIAGVLLYQLYPQFQKWRVDRRKFTCDACKTPKRTKDGFAPLAVDLEYDDGLVPLNLRLCRSCAPIA